MSTDDGAVCIVDNRPKQVAGAGAFDNAIVDWICFAAAVYLRGPVY